MKQEFAYQYKATREEVEARGKMSIEAHAMLRLAQVVDRECGVWFEDYESIHREWREDGVLRVSVVVDME